jgi:hypothetical protein
MCLPITKVQNLMTISFQLAKAELSIIALKVPQEPAESARLAEVVGSDAAAAGVSLQVNATSA